MAYGYLLAPSFQFVNINGRPIANGHLEVFLTNTDTKYITKCDFNGTDNPFKIPLNSKGMAVVIASGDYAYDVFCYDQFGSPFWSGSNIRIEGAIGVVIDGANLPLRIVGGKIDNNGKELTCTGENAWAEGAETTASGANAHAEGGETTASGEHSHSEGFRTTASSGYSHAEGAGSKATNTASHSEGQDTTASGQASHAEGRGSVASGDYSHASGRGTRATGEGSTAVGKWNDDGDALFVVGGGTASNNRKDVFKVDRNGDTWVLVNNALVRVNNCSQFVLTRSNMTTAFTNDEYSECVDSVTNGIAVCVQVGTSLQLQLTQIDSLGIHFDATFGDYHYTYVVAPTANAHTITENIRHFGTPIYATLQDAISDADALHVGMYFETNGFHTSGDGGGARYLVSTSGTANGMDIISLATGKFAVFQWGMVTTPEQLGAYGDGTHNDTSVFEHIITYYSSATDMQTKRIIQGSLEKKYLISDLFVHDVQIRQCSFKGTGLTTGIGIKLGSRAIIDTCILSEFTNAIYTGNTDNAVHSIITGCTISWCGNGIYLASGRDTMGASVDGIRIDNCYISNLGTLGHSSYSTPPSWDSTGCAIWLYGNFKNVVITDNVLEYNGYAGLRLECRNNQYEPSATIIGNYFEGNKFSAIWIFLQKRPCAIEITGNQLTKIFDNVHVTTSIFATSVMSPYPIESPYGRFIGVATTNNGSTYLNVNANNLYSSILTIYPTDLVANKFAIIPAKVANSRSPLKVLSIKGRGDASIAMTITYIDSSNVSHSTSVVADASGKFDAIIPMQSINLYDGLLGDITIEITSVGWTFLAVTEIAVA